MADNKTEWARIGEENARFVAWFRSEVEPKFEGADAFVKSVAERAAFMAWYAALGLDFDRALTDERHRIERLVEARNAGK